jgi:hypothetical protein
MFQDGLTETFNFLVGCVLFLNSSKTGQLKHEIQLNKGKIISVLNYRAINR